jgi:hypothetical protein
MAALGFTISSAQEETKTFGILFKLEVRQHFNTSNIKKRSKCLGFFVSIRSKENEALSLPPLLN